MPPISKDTPSACLLSFLIQRVVILLHDLTVCIGGGISRNNTSCFYELPFFGILPNRCGGESAPVLLTGSSMFLVSQKTG